MTINLQIPNSTIKKVTGYILLLGLCIWYFCVLFTPYYRGSEYFEMVFFPLVIFAVNAIFISLFKKTTRRWWVLPVVMSFLQFVFSMQDLHVDYAWEIILASISSESYRQAVINKYAFQGHQIEVIMEPLKQSIKYGVYIFLEIVLSSVSLSLIYVKLTKYLKSKRE